MVLARRTAVATAAVALLAVPLGLPKFYLLLATEILIMGLFAMAFNLLLGYAGMVSFGHAAFYGVGAYTCGLLLKKADVPFAMSFLAAPVVAAAVASSPPSSSRARCRDWRGRCSPCSAAALSLTTRTGPSPPRSCS